MTLKIIPAVSLLMLLLCLSTGHTQWNIDVETGYVFSGYNEARIPNKTGTLISLSEELEIDPELFFRARATYAFNERHFLSVLVAPLRLTTAGAVDKQVSFAGHEFPPNVDLEGRYRFDSYRLTYRFDFHRSENMCAGVGITAKIRDASISLESSDRSAEKKNTGFVPLINFRLHWRPQEKLQGLLEGDALAAPQGRAEDILLAVQYRPQEEYGLRFGYRFLEGGADVDETYNFALLHYLVLGATISF